MTDQHKRCFNFIKDYYSKEDLECGRSKAIVLNDINRKNTDEFEEGKDGQIRRIRNDSGLDFHESPKKRRKSDVHHKDSDLRWLWIVLN